MSESAMKKRNAWVKGLVGAVGMLLTAGCVEGPTALMIQQNQIPMSANGLCVIPAERTNTVVGRGIFDVSLVGYGYEMYPLLTNTAPDLSHGGYDPNRVEVSGFEVEIKAPPSLMVAWTAACPARFDYAFQTAVAPKQDVGSYVEVMRPCHAAVIRDLFKSGKLSANPENDVVFNAVIRARGTHGGKTIHSDYFQFPIQVCYGCLQRGIVVGGQNYDFPRVPPCATLISHPYTGNTCNIAQDRGPVLCCALDDAGTQLECPGVPRIIPPKI
jgi:hypothetical protein